MHGAAEMSPEQPRAPPDETEDIKPHIANDDEDDDDPDVLAVGAFTVLQSVLSLVTGVLYISGSDPGHATEA